MARSDVKPFSARGRTIDKVGQRRVSARAFKIRGVRLQLRAEHGLDRCLGVAPCDAGVKAGQV